MEHQYDKIKEYVGIRISDVQEGGLSKTLEVFQKYYQEYHKDKPVIGVFEDPKIIQDGQYVSKQNPHYHFIIGNVMNSNDFGQAIRRFFTKEDERFKNPKSGFKVLIVKSYTDIGKGMYYLSKGPFKILRSPPNVVINNCISNSEFMDYHNSYWDKQASETADIDETSKAKREISLNSALIKHFYNDVLPRYTKFERLDISPRQVKQEMLNYLCIFKKGANSLNPKTFAYQYNMLINSVFYDKYIDYYEDWEVRFLEQVDNYV